MNKTLYISDLDGTLLDPDARLTEYTTQALRQLIARGLCFGVATARTREGACPRLRELLPLPAPMVLLNGAVIYDSQTQTFIKQETIAPEDLRRLLARVRAHGQTGFLYSLQGNDIIPYHEPLTSQVLLDFKNERLERYSHFAETTDLSLHTEHIVYFTTQDSRERLLPLYEEIKHMPALDCVLYADTYLPDNWYLECFSHAASKGSAIAYLRRTFGYETVVGFGDNLNDLCLFDACDEAYAVANAREELKARATGIIGAHTEDGVAKFLERTFA